MKIAISGATGFVGKSLSTYLQKKGEQVIPLERGLFAKKEIKQIAERIKSCAVIINLSGAPIQKRWSESYKAELRRSRVEVTRKLVQAIRLLPVKPKLFISTSAIGYYSSVGCHDAYKNARGAGFLSSLCVNWEREAMQTPSETRVVINRFGLVLDPSGGALAQMSQTFPFGFGLTIGRGDQAFSWISLDDLVRALYFEIQTPTLSGIFNLVAPETICQRTFMQQLAKKHKRFLLLPVPKVLIRLLMGQVGQVYCTGQCVRPTRLLESGFSFRHTTTAAFLASYTL
ncbi:MAG: TIGR01777 family oxidoreductase [Bacteroidaceae bacterium]|nr:TIGR01777 family oxidoreductase [Bacteroidaceae bacterium]